METAILKNKNNDTFLALINNEKLLYCISFFAIALVLAPYYLFGERIPIRIHDNLDSNWVWYKMVADTLPVFSADVNAAFAQISGATVGMLPAGSSFLSLLLRFLSVFQAITLVRTMMCLVGFAGMLLLLKRHFAQAADAGSNFILFGCATLFAIMPFWAPGVLSVAGLPLYAYAMLNCRFRKAKTTDYIIVFVLPYFMGLVTVGVFLLACFGLYFVYVMVKEKRWHWEFFIALVLSGVMFILANLPLLLAQSAVVWHRTEFYAPAPALGNILRKAANNFLKGHSHSAAFATIPMLLAGVLAVGLGIKEGLKDKRPIYLFLLLGFTSLLFGVYTRSRFLNGFNYSRLYWFQPVLWVVLFAVCLAAIVSALQKSGRKAVQRLGVVLSLLLLIAQGASIYERQEYLGGIPYQGFYAEKQFSEISDYIGKPHSEYRVISVGLHPSVAQYNDFYTLDFYLPNYSLAYKHEFRKIIAGELEKDGDIKESFDGWGSRCYAFSSELTKNVDYVKSKELPVIQLDYDFDQFASMGGQYILSAVPINNKQLHLMKTFEDDVSVWKIHLYSV